MIVLQVVTSALVAAGAIWVFVFCVRATLRAEHLRGVLSLQGMNESDVATANFIETVRRAETSLVIHDDGNNMEGSVYNDQKAIDAVVTQMNKHESLSVKCWFNVESAPELGLVAAMRNDGRLATRFAVRYRKPSPLKLWRFSWFDPHYKIADGGEYGTVSRHAFGAMQRRFGSRTAPKRPRRARTSRWVHTCVASPEASRTGALGPAWRSFGSPPYVHRAGCHDVHDDDVLHIVQENSIDRLAA